MNKIFIYLIISLVSVTWISCEDDYNDWEVEEGHDRLFKAITFDVSDVEATSVELKFTTIVSAEKYVFEFSEDSLEFSDIVQTVEMPADTLTAYSENSNAVKTEYREIISGLNGTTGYLVRMKGVNDSTGLESNWSEVYFETTDEQIFTGYSVTTNSISLTWTVTDSVSDVYLLEENADSGVAYELSDAQKSAGSVTFNDLSSGTNYIATIYYGDVKRGTMEITTSGLSNGVTYEVLDDDDCSTIGTALTDLVAEGSTNINVVFNAGQTYELGGSITIPTGVNDIAFVGSEDADSTLTTLESCRFGVESSVNNIYIQYLSISSDGSYTVRATSGEVINNIYFQHCDITDLNSIVRIGSTTTANAFYVTDCWISDTGGYGVFNVGSGSSVDSIVVDNCTMTEISTRFADVRCSTVIQFSNITCCNINAAMGHLWYFDKSMDIEVTIENCIIAGPNNNTELRSTNGTYDNISISYANCYQTSDLPIEEGYELTDITTLTLTYDELFEDPDNGDFHIKSGTGFAGTGVAGDERWFE